MRLANGEQCSGEPAGRSADFKFRLNLRVHCSTTLWNAAAERCLHAYDVPADDLADLIGPKEDPSVDDCLMVLTIPDAIPGCTFLDVSLDEADHTPTVGALHERRIFDDALLCACAI